MSEPFVAEIKMTATNFAQRNWAFCNGQLLQIAQNTALFSLVGTTYGGDGRVTFALPNMQGRAPMHPGTGPGLTPRALGQNGGTETVTLTPGQVANHTHTMQAVAELGSSTSPDGRSLAQSPTGRGGYGLYDNADNKGAMATGALANTGGGQAHDNMQPYQVVNFQIALTGIYPSRA